MREEGRGVRVGRVSGRGWSFGYLVLMLMVIKVLLIGVVFFMVARGLLYVLGLCIGS